MQTAPPLPSPCTQWEIIHGRCGSLSPSPMPPPMPPLVPEASCAATMNWATMDLLACVGAIFGLYLYSRVPIVGHFSQLVRRLGLILAAIAPSIGAYVASVSTAGSAARLDSCATMRMNASLLVSVSSVLFYAFVVSRQALRQRTSFLRRLAAIEQDLPNRLEDGTIQLLRVSFLLAQPKSWIIQRRDDLPREAFVPLHETKRLLEQHAIGCLSYRWLTADHPDPQGVHLNALRSHFESACFHRTEAIFWDYGSIPQKPRTTHTEEVFRRALKSMAKLYASPRVVVLQHKGMGGVKCTFPQDPDGQPDYDHSGWCTFEQAAASLFDAGQGSTLYELGAGWAQHKITVKTPEEITRIMQDERCTKFVGRGDRTEVPEMYKELHEKMLAIEKIEQLEMSMRLNGGTEQQAWQRRGYIQLLGLETA